MSVEMFKKSVCQIALGLYKKEKKFIEDRDRYHYIPELHKGINILYSLRFIHGKNKELILNSASETAFIKEFASKPLTDWYSDLDENFVEEINKDRFFKGYSDGFVVILEDGVYETTGECLELIDRYGIDLKDGFHSRMIYESMLILSQDEYVILRKFITENPVIMRSELVKFKSELTTSSKMSDIISRCYEDIHCQNFICKHCGWTMKSSGDTFVCVSKRCNRYRPTSKYIADNIIDNKIYLRLNKSIMRFICLPGKLELEIYNFCKDLGIEVSLYPKMDRYDVEIRFDDGEVWEIDGKTFENPYHLANKIKESGGFKSGEYHKGFYVVYDYLKEEKPDYLKIINDSLKEYSDKIQCVTLRQLKKLLKTKREALR